jgi:tetraacyldisaccharide 4'-kinase
VSGWVERLWYPEEPEGVGRQVALGPLWLASQAFGLGVAARNWAYDSGLFSAQRVEGARVVSVGNLNVGGAGKTPVVIHLARLATRLGLRTAVISRGHGRTLDGPRCFTAEHLPSVEEAGDEPLLIARKCPSVTVLVGSERARQAQQARTELGAELILLDDGMQHRQLYRDAEVVVVDGPRGLGNGALLPRGPLREPPSALGRATLIWWRGERAPEGLAQPWVLARHRLGALLGPKGERQELQALRGAKVIAVAALARPAAFLRDLGAQGAELVATHLFPDHHRFSAAELAGLREEAKARGAIVVTTEKDQMRLPPDFPAHVVQLEVEVLEGQARLEQVLTGLGESR